MILLILSSKILLLIKKKNKSHLNYTHGLKKLSINHLKCKKIKIYPNIKLMSLMISIILSELPPKIKSTRSIKVSLKGKSLNKTSFFQSINSMEQSVEPNKTLLVQSMSNHKQISYSITLLDIHPSFTSSINK